MSLGFDAISALPFATSGPDTDVQVQVTGNSLTITIGSVGVIADAVTENLTANQLALGTGTLSITADANHTVTGNALSLDTVEPGVITWNDIIPGATMVWTPIKPY